MFKAKVLLVGPSESGKTVLANFLSDATETVGGEYNPTQGVRILEFESSNVPNVNGSNKSSGCEVELWDCGGDPRFETCWPAMMKDSHGVVIVFNPDLPSHLKETEMWHSSFVQQQQFQDNQCLLIAHHKPGSGTDKGRPPLATSMTKLKLLHSSLEEDPEDVRTEFLKFLGGVITSLSEVREREEMSIIT
ncbi:intraflagellar transport protein 22 homolog isoform X1 [Rhinatrema bivittatum]|uniref:intraflagellar transport protein 22 homolog isoform X1 n=1 Tax=Rhinatrema bivittatum TaxID=194408 RepID=UPI00112BAC1A|nr:intraflagellar transport protein 22 homolog isoform X1 [Rhinatrema bivittatum]XP_029468532.1 intraflagellar transport protein 22 homolog isoform X1 [Rhinatrema bivittatum]